MAEENKMKLTLWGDDIKAVRMLEIKLSLQMDIPMSSKEKYP